MTKVMIVDTEFNDKCRNCENYKGKVGVIFTFINLIKCKTSAEISEDENCPACTKSLTFIGNYYGAAFLHELITYHKGEKYYYRQKE